MPDKVGFLIGPKLRDWTRYSQWFSDKLAHNIPIMKLPAGGADGDTQKIVDAATTLANDPDIKVIVTAGTGAALACKAARKGIGNRLSLQRSEIRGSADWSQCQGPWIILPEATTGRLTTGL